MERLHFTVYVFGARRNLIMQSISFFLRLLFVLCWIGWASVPGVSAQEDGSSQWPLHDNGLNEAVEWDHYSFKIHGERIFIFSGEIHYWRIPVPEVWEDILEKIKAAGFTSFAFYGHWGYHHPNPSTLDFENGAHDITPLFEIAKRVGLYVIVRPGPYVNAETNAGCFPGWLTTGEYGTLRNNDTRYTDAWTPYMSEYSELVSNYQVSQGENVYLYQIENEYGEQWIGDPTDKVPNPTATAYMDALEATARANGIDVPLIANDPNMRVLSWSEDFSDAGGNVDVYGLDSYPSCWSCNLDECTGTNGEYVAYQVMEYYSHFQEVAPTQPEFMPEFQGGSYNPWGGPQGGCPEDIGADFANLFYRWNIAQKITAMNLYMMYGGTSWGSFAAPVVATSYDYSAPISEDRSIWSKFHETKLLALFTRAAKDLTKVERVGNSTDYTTNPMIMATLLENVDNGARFYVTNHADTSLGSLETFSLHVNSSAGPLIIPQKGGEVTLNGHQSKILVVDFNFGSHVLLYSTAEVLTYAVTDVGTILVLWVPTDESGEFHLKGATDGSIAKYQQGSNVEFFEDDEGIITTFTQGQGMTVLEFENDVSVIILDRKSAYHFWAPVTSNDPSGPADEIVLVHGPYLVRGASINGDIVYIKGDTSEACSIEVYAPGNVDTISWNNETVNTTKSDHGSLIAELGGPDMSEVVLPALDSWKVHDSLPERLETYNDSGAAWKGADHVETPNPTKPATLPVLYVDEYGFHNGAHLWRGYFNGTANGAYLRVQGGLAFGFSVWLNGQFLDSYLGSADSSSGNLTLSFANATLNDAEPNVLLVLQDNTGHDLRAGALDPRGILEARLIGGDFTHWKVAGSAGGTAVLLDPMRGVYAEGGLTAERLGWHLPGFDDSAWDAGSPSEGLTGAGVNFYRTVVPLDIPQGLDVSLAFELSSLGPSDQVRVQLFVNGYQYGRFNPHIGHQIEFPVPPGVLNYGGDNTIGLAVWAQTEEAASVGIELKKKYVLESSFSSRFESEYLRPGWTPERLQYA
ncbi:glycoside hydrolase superfamily [Lineolata rhizophorae]|uniref:beta-galactosidase n=1 Tax=Lineolata rhizophorae TaxID=578093 RepID=A0A6A6P1D6_9PEZI|nr:glycoside hydrolase superfamily [Lineolata rhizophorae]